MKKTRQILLIGSFLTTGVLFAQGPPGFDEDVNDANAAPIPGIALAAAVGVALGFKFLRKDK